MMLVLAENDRANITRPWPDKFEPDNQALFSEVAWLYAYVHTPPDKVIDSV